MRRQEVAVPESYATDVPTPTSGHGVKARLEPTAKITPQKLKREGIENREGPFSGDGLLLAKIEALKLISPRSFLDELRVRDRTHQCAGALDPRHGP